MTQYIAPLHDIQFVLRELAGLDQIAALPGHEETTADLVEAIIEEAGKFATGVLSPLNRSGDIEGARWSKHDVFMPSGWSHAYKLFSEAGWTSLTSAREHGGQNLPQLVAAFVEEIWNGANMAFALSPMLTRGAQQVLELQGSDYLKRTFLPPMVRGEWTGTMVLTEPQAGSDLAAVRTRAVRDADGAYRLYGQKIFITYGDHDLAPNIAHLVLARVEGAPEGTKGISLFLVPKYMVNEDGSLGARNDVRCVSLEHKMGIHASPTCVMAFGDNEGAAAYLVGDENRGLEYMFIMMNAARFAVGLEGVGLAERAYQRALAYARERLQGTEAGSGSGARVAIIRHPDVRRMLLSMKSRIEAMRALTGVIAAAMDIANRHPDEAVREENQSFVELMMPVAKGWFTETGIDIASMAIQVHGGVGFIEETGAAQHLRDARITAIYEGTTGIQAADLVGRKVAREGGKSINALIERMRAVQRDLEDQDDPDLTAISRALQEGLVALCSAVRFILETYPRDPRRALVGSVPFLELFSIVAGGWQMGRAALIAKSKLPDSHAESDFYLTKIQTARFYAEHVLSRASGLSRTMTAGADAALAIEDGNF